MSRMLAMVSVIGLALCAVFLGGAWALGGDDIFHDQRSLQGLKPLIDLATRKEWHWAGGDTLALDAPITVRYEPQTRPSQGKPNISITGPADAMDHIRVQAGRITADTVAPEPAPGEAKEQVQAVLSGVPIRKFIVNSSENLQLGHIDQEELAIYINGNGKVSGDGKVQDLTLVLNGPGRADLGALQVDDASVSILGPGQVTLSPHGDVKLFAVGNSKVTLLTTPEHMQRRIFGGVTISTPDGTETTQPPRLPVAPREERAPVPPSSPVEAAPATPMPMPMPMPMPRVAGAEAGRDAGRDAGRIQERLTVRGKENVDMGHIEQERLVVTVSGQGSARAEGRVEELEVQVMGSGNANLGRLTAGNVKVTVAGSGNVTVAPTENVKVNIIGSGNVRLTTKPVQIERRITGSGHVIEAP